MGIFDDIKSKAYATGRLSPSQMDTAIQRRNEMQDRLAEVKMMQEREAKNKRTLQNETHQTAAHLNMRPVLGNQLIFYKKRQHHRHKEKHWSEWEL